MKDVSLLAFLLLFVLHHDLWFWDDATLILGLPVGLTYHVALCLQILPVSTLQFGLATLTPD